GAARDGLARRRSRHHLRLRDSRRLAGASLVGNEPRGRRAPRFRDGAEPLRGPGWTGFGRVRTGGEHRGGPRPPPGARRPRADGARAVEREPRAGAAAPHILGRSGWRWSRGAAGPLLDRSRSGRAAGRGPPGPGTLTRLDPRATGTGM